MPNLDYLVAVVVPDRPYINSQFQSIWREAERQRHQGWQFKFFKLRHLRDLLESSSKFNFLIVEQRAASQLGAFADDPSIRSKGLQRLRSLANHAEVSAFMAAFDLHALGYPSESTALDTQRIDSLRCTLRLLADSFPLLFWNHEKGAVGLSEVDRGHRDPWMANFGCPKESQEFVKGLWANRAELHFPASKGWVDTGTRRFTAVVPGYPYTTRKLALRSAETAGVSVYPYLARDRAIRGVSRLYGSRSDTEDRFVNALRRKNYWRGLHNSQFSFLCGSGFRYAVAKFFEAAASGATPVGVPFVGANDAGFVHNDTFIECAPEEFGKVIAGFSSTASRSIGRAFSEMSRELHSPGSRIHQLLSSLEAVLESDSPILATFKDSKYVITTAS